MTTIQLQLPTQTANQPINPESALPAGTPTPRIHTGSDILFKLLTYTICCVILIKFFYQFWPEIVNRFNDIVRSREYVESHGVRYSPVAYLTKKAESKMTTEIAFNKIDTIYTIPDNISNITQAQSLAFGFIPIRSLPNSIGNMSSLRDILITNTWLQSLPPSISNLTSLRSLNLQGNRLTSLPETIGALHDLESLNLAYNNLSSLPQNIEQLTNLKLLDLTGNKLTSFPKHLPSTLEALYIGNNAIPFKELNDAAHRFSLTNLVIYY